MPDINQILSRNPRSCTFGAPMGDRDTDQSDSPLHVQRVRLVDGDYGPDGTYWGGGGEHIYCAFNGEDDKYAPAMGTRIYVRAYTRAGAIEAIRESYPDATFKRG